MGVDEWFVTRATSEALSIRDIAVNSTTCRNYKKLLQTAALSMWVYEAAEVASACAVAVGR